MGALMSALAGRERIGEKPWCSICDMRLWREVVHALVEFLALV
jgi:hypothetical protein